MGLSFSELEKRDIWFANGGNHSLPFSERMLRSLSKFEKNIFDDSLIFGFIIPFAFHPELFSCLNTLGQDSLEKLRTYLIRHMPAHPEDAGTSPGYLNIRVRKEFSDPEYQGDLKFREDLYLRWLRIWEYLNPQMPLPAFKPVRIAGRILDVAEVDHSVVIFDIHAHFMRWNPLLLVHPDKPPIKTIAIKIDHVERSTATIRRLDWKGALGLFLAENVRSIDDAPIGTEVWIDRTNAPPIPPRPEGW